MPRRAPWSRASSCIVVVDGVFCGRFLLAGHICSTADPPIIRVESLTAGYDDKSILLKNISFDVRRGEVFVILGGSGCGKSTLLKHMIGLYDRRWPGTCTSTATTS